MHRIKHWKTALVILAALSASLAVAQNFKAQNADTLQQVRISAVIEPFIYGREQTTAHIQEYQNYWTGPTAYDFEWRKVGEKFIGVIDERMPEVFERGNWAVVTLYRIGHSDDSSRDPLFTMSEEKAKGKR